MKEIPYWVDKAGSAGVLGGAGETVTRLVYDSNYLGPEQVDEGMGIMTAGLAAWTAAKYVQERGRRRSPLVHAGRVMEVAGPAMTEYKLQRGEADNIFRTFGPAALGMAAGAFLEYVAGPIHERLSSKYQVARKLTSRIYDKTTENGARAIIGHVISEGKSRDEMAELLEASVSDAEIRRYLEMWEK